MAPGTTTSQEGKNGSTPFRPTKYSNGFKKNNKKDCFREKKSSKIEKNPI
jgi:hypothetical protein